MKPTNMSYRGPQGSRHQPQQQQQPTVMEQFVDKLNEHNPTALKAWFDTLPANEQFNVRIWLRKSFAAVCYASEAGIVNVANWTSEE